MKKSGFTLIELSIVLVIIGLVVGGVLVGRTLIKTSELQAMIKEKDQYITAVNTFRLKYNAVPGDMGTATNYWPADANCPWNARATPGRTCNGNGDGGIVSNGWDNIQRYEIPLAWQHLSLAGLIPGNYTGEMELAGYTLRPGERAPTSAYGDVRKGWQMFWIGAVVNNSYFFDGSYNHVLIYGDPYPNANTMYGITGADQFWLDTKIDDGFPKTGRLRSAPYTGAWQSGIRCLIAPAQIYYDTSKTTQECVPIFMGGF